MIRNPHPLLAAMLGFGLMLAVAGCAAIKPPETTVTLRLMPALPAASARRDPTARIGVAPVTARGFAGGLRYAYIDAATPAEIRLAAHLFWEESPTHVLERALVAGLRTRYELVAGPEIGTPMDRRVIARIDRFEEASAGGAARAVIAFDVTVTGAALLNGHYCASIPIDSASPSTRAAAFDAAIGQAVNPFAGDLAGGRLTSSSC